MKSQTISIRLSESMLEALDNFAKHQQKHRTQAIREAISNYLELPENSDRARLETLETENKELMDKLIAEIKRNNNLELRIEVLESTVIQLKKILKNL